MIVGIDVYHDSTFGQKKSVVGFIASTNRYVQLMLVTELDAAPPSFLTSSITYSTAQ